MYAFSYLSIVRCCLSWYTDVSRFSFLDIGMYMMGYNNFVSDPYASYYLGQWIMTYDVTYWICRIFDLHSFMSLRVLHWGLILLTQTLIYFYLRSYINRQYIILGLFMATLAHFGSYTEITYNDYSAFLLMISLMSFHHGVEKRGLLACLGCRSCCRSSCVLSFS